MSASLSSRDNSAVSSLRATATIFVPTEQQPQTPSNPDTLANSDTQPAESQPSTNPPSPSPSPAHSDEKPAEEKHKSHCAEKNALIQSLQLKDENLRIEEQDLQASIRRIEVQVAHLTAELESLQPLGEKALREYSIKEKKVKVKRGRGAKK
ncbi:hypothetical protein ACEQ8H_006524 [Pleosporales sp. CAS-2024a]